MKVSLILAHPDPKSLNHAIAGRAHATLRAGGHARQYMHLSAEPKRSDRPKKGGSAPFDAERCEILADVADDEI